MLVEMANRGGGSGTVSHCIPAVSGVNVLEAYVRQSVGEHVIVKQTQHKGSVMRFQIYPDGVVKEILGFEEAKQIPGVVILVHYINPGDVLKPIVMDTQRHGLFITEGENLREAEKVMDEVERTIEIVYE
jgi:hypothetical protein